MINERIYQVNWKRLILWLIPRPMRKLEMVQWLLAIIIPIIRLFNLLLNLRNYHMYWLGINSQVCFLEKMLNDRYDPEQRRIYIAKNETSDPLYIYLEGESKPVYIFKANENDPIYLFTNSETLAGGADFVVIIPTSLSINENELNALIDKNKLPDKEHSIKRI